MANTILSFKLNHIQYFNKFSASNNGKEWAILGSSWFSESSVIYSGIQKNAGATSLQKLWFYPKATFSSNMQAILPQGPWVSADERQQRRGDCPPAYARHSRSRQVSVYDPYFKGSTCPGLKFSKELGG